MNITTGRAILSLEGAKKNASTTGVTGDQGVSKSSVFAGRLRNLWNSRYRQFRQFRASQHDDSSNTGER